MRAMIVGLVLFCGCTKPQAPQQPVKQQATSPITSHDARLVITVDDPSDRRSVDTRWIGEMDDPAMELAAADIYEQLRSRMNAFLAERPTTNKIFVTVELCRRPADQKGLGDYYFTANSGDLASTIPPWEQAEKKYPLHQRDADTRPSPADEELYLKFDRQLMDLTGSFTVKPGSDLYEVVAREDVAKQQLRSDFCASHGLTVEDLRGIESHYVLWSLGEKVTPERLRDFMEQTKKD
jgi:hypothetical protein